MMRRRVLVVDDHPEAADLLRVLLEDRGHETFVEHDGVRGLAAALEWRPHLVLLDLSLPGLRGEEVARRVRDALGEEAPRLVALTGHAAEDVRAACLAAGFDAVATKPSSLEALERFLEAQLDA